MSAPHAYKFEIQVEILQRGPITEELAKQLVDAAHYAVSQQLKGNGTMPHAYLSQAQGRILPLYERDQFLAGPFKPHLFPRPQDDVGEQP